MKDPVARRKWIQILNRHPIPPQKRWEPAQGDRVCSEHFVDGAPTKVNPFPTQKLGYESKNKVKNIIDQGVFSSPPRPPKKQKKESKPKKKNIDFHLSSLSSSVPEPANYVDVTDHAYVKNPFVLLCRTRKNTFTALVDHNFIS